MKKIMISAYACSPDSVSEAGAAWMQVYEILKRKKYKLILFTRKKYISDIDSFLVKSEFKQFLTVIGIDFPKATLFWKKGHLSMHVYYYLWQILAFIKAKRICKYQTIALIHHISFMTIRTNMIPFLGIPSILGPAGGAQLPPRGFSKILRHPFKERLRFFTLLTMKYSPLWNYFIKKVSLVLIANKSNAWILPENCNFKIQQIGWTNSNIANVCNNKYISNDILHIYWGGRIIGWKGLELLINALPSFKITGIKFQLDISGKGPEEQLMKALVIENDLSKNVTFHGWVTNSEKEELQNKSDICVFTSLHETTGTALLEMMDKEKALIVINHAGPGEIVDDLSAILIDVDGGAIKAIRQISNALYTFAKDKNLRNKFGNNAKIRLHNKYGLDKYIDSICDTYEELSKSC